MLLLGPSHVQAGDVAPADASSDARPALERVARLAARVGGASAAVVAVAAADGYVVVAAVGVARGVLGQRLPAPPALLHGPRRATTPARTAAHLAAAVVTRLGWSDVLAVPVRGRGGEVLGAILVRAPGAPSADDAAGRRGTVRTALTDLAAVVADELALAAAAEAERRACANEARLRALVRHGSELLGVVDLDGCLRYLSPAILRARGPRAAGAIGTSAFDLVHPGDVPMAKAMLARVGGEPRARATGRLRAVRGDEAVRTLDVLVENRLDDPDVGGIVVAARDVTEAVLLEAQLRHAQKREAVGRLASGLAHDFNNVLTVVGTSARLVRETLADGAGVTCSPAVAAVMDADLDEIERGVRRAAALTRQLLTFSRARPTPAPTPVSLPAVLRGVEGMVRRVMGEQVNVVFTLDEAPDAGVVLADPGELEHVVLNLAVNARDAMPDGGVFTVDTRTVHLKPAEAELVGCSAGAWVVLEVQDTGTGMDADAQARAFEPFFSTKAAGEGTGLGLAMVQAIVAQAGGRVTVRSAVGAGTTFALWFPRMAPAAAEEGDASAPAVGEATAPDAPRAREAVDGPETVLVVEDEHGVRQIACRALERFGYRVLDARHGAEALRVWAAHGGPAGRVDLVLTDCTMPVMGGRELVTELRARRPDQAVLLMSGQDSVGERAWAEEEDVVIVEKPFGAADLAVRLRAALDGVTA